MLDKLHLIICLFAAIVIAILNLVNRVPLEKATVNLITIIVLFYLLGLAAKYYLNKYVFPPEEKEEDSEDSEDAEEAEDMVEQADAEMDEATTDEVTVGANLPIRERKPRKPVASLAETEDRA